MCQISSMGRSARVSTLHPSDLCDSSDRVAKVEASSVRFAIVVIAVSVVKSCAFRERAHC